jgi:hypothetical protein
MFCCSRRLDERPTKTPSTCRAARSSHFFSVEASYASSELRPLSVWMADTWARMSELQVRR